MSRLTEADVRRKATNLLKIHGLTGWKIVFNNSRRFGGTCTYAEKKIVFSRIHIRARTDAGIKELIKHEVGHAVAGPVADHGEAWQRVVRAMGGKATVKWDLEEIQDPTIIFLWVYTCTGCDQELGRSAGRQKFGLRFVTKCCHAPVSSKYLRPVAA